MQSSSWDLHVTSSCHRIKVYSVNTSKPATAARLKEIEEIVGRDVLSWYVDDPIPDDYRGDEEAQDYGTDEGDSVDDVGSVEEEG